MRTNEQKMYFWVMMKRLTLIHIAHFIRSRGCVLCVVLCVVLGLGTLLPMAIVVEVEAVLFQLTKALLRMYIRNDRKNLRFSATLNHNCVLIDCEIYRK